MKKAVAVLLMIIMLLSFSGCGEDYRRKWGNDAVDAVRSMDIIPDDIKSECSAEIYTMDITLDDSKNKISGTVNVEVLNNGDEALGKICFNLFNACFANAEIVSAQNGETGKKYSIEKGNTNSTFYVNLGKDKCDGGDFISINLEFYSEIRKTSDRLGYYQDKNGKLYNLSFCFPQLTFKENGEWVERDYSGMGESRYSEMSDYYVTFRAPDGYEIVSTGTVISEDDGFVIEAENVREFALSACNFARVITKESEDITYNLMMPEFEGYDDEWLDDYADVIMTTAIESVEIYTESFGGYIYDELDMVTVFYDGSLGGMEFPGFIQIGMPTDMGGEIYDMSVSTTCHEVGHQWFYCAVGNNEADEPWLDEGFASYADRYFYLKEKHSTKKMQAFDEKNGYSSMNNGFADESQYKFYINFPTEEYAMEDYTCIYEDGAEFLRALELAMGEDVFLEMFSNWYNQNTNEIVTGAEFVFFVLDYDSSEEVVDIINKFISDERI